MTKRVYADEVEVVAELLANKLPRAVPKVKKSGLQIEAEARARYITEWCTDKVNDWENKIFRNRALLYVITQQLALADIVRLTSVSKQMMRATVEPDASWTAGEKYEWIYHSPGKRSHVYTEADKIRWEDNKARMVKREKYEAKALRLRVLEEWMRPHKKYDSNLTESKPRESFVEVWWINRKEREDPIKNEQLLAMRWNLTLGPVISKARTVSEIAWRYRPFKVQLDHHAYVGNDSFYNEGVSDWPNRWGGDIVRMRKRLTCATVFNMRATCNLLKEHDEVPEFHVQSGTYTPVGEISSAMRHRTLVKMQAAARWDKNIRYIYAPMRDARGDCKCHWCVYPQDTQWKETYTYQKWHEVKACHELDDFHDDNEHYAVTFRDHLEEWVPAEQTRATQQKIYFNQQDEYGNIHIIRNVVKCEEMSE